MRLRIDSGRSRSRSALPVLLIVGSLLALSEPASPASATGTTQWIANQSVESTATGWAGSYNSTSVTTRVTPGFDGSFSLRSVNKSTKTGTNGFNDKPRWISGSGASATVAGTVYTGSVWVKADVVGEKITLFLRELNAAGAPVNKAPNNVGMTVTANGTGWFNITQAYPAAANGDALSFIVYASNVPAGKGFDADLMSLTSPTATTGDTVKPTAPASVTATATSQTEIDLAWTAATDNVGVTGYTVQRGGQTIATTAGTTFSDTGLTAGTAYSYSVVAMDAAGNAGPPGTAAASTPPVLGAPTNLHASSVSATEVDLSWTAATGATSYAIQRDGLGAGTTSATQFADTTVSANTSYTYVVVATDAFGGSSPSAAFAVDTGDSSPPPPPPPPPPLTLCGNAAPATTVAVQHVVIVMLENHSYQQVVGNSAAPYQTNLATTCGNATAMFGTTHASAANYLATSAGEFPAVSAKGCGSVSGCGDASDNLYHQLDVAGLSWRSYQESMPTACAASTGGSYKIGHNPPLFYGDIPLSECRANDLPVTNFTDHSGPFWDDLQAQTLPSLSWVTPNLVNDGDTGTPTAALAAADKWLTGFLGTVQQSASYQAGNTVVLVTYDEGTGADAKTGEDCTNQALDLPITNGVSAHQDSCHIPLFVVSPFTPTGTADATFFDHYSLTKTVEELFGLPLLAHAADPQTTSLRGHFGIS
jgi:phosphatidylinositol-3-phosphatase